MINKFWDKKCFLTNKERLRLILNDFRFCNYKKQTKLYCQDCSQKFTIEKSFRYFEELAEDLNAVYSFNFSREVVDFVRDEYGIEITEKMVNDFAKRYKK